jgi:ribosome-binding factor A
MSGHRIERINEQIKKELAVLVPQLKDPRIPHFLSVTEVKTSADLKTARVYVSIMDSNESDVIKGLNSSAGHLRSLLASNLKLRYTPMLDFHIDNSIKYGMEIDRKLSELRLDKDNEQ